MTTQLSGPVRGDVPATRTQLDWLRRQTDDWRAEGIIDEVQANAILARYHAGRGFSVARLLLGLGATFVGVGVIWLVAANLDELSPLVRFGLVSLLWLAALVGAELLAGRRTAPVVVGAVRLLAAFGSGAVVFQAAQSLQVPAYEPKLVGLWAAMALVQAYAFRAYGPLLVGLAGGVGWSIWQGLWWPDPTLTRAVWVITLSALLAVGLAGLHERWAHRFGAAWRQAGALLALAGLFVAGIPVDEGWDLTWTWWPVLLGVLAALAGAAVLALGPGNARWEVLGALGVLGVSLALVSWPAGGDPNNVTGADWAHAILGVVTYVAVAVGLAVVGTLRDSWVLTAMATAGLVVFTTFQSFAVFAPIIQGAWLFVVLGVVFLATGVGFDRVRRRLAENLEDVREEEGS